MKFRKALERINLSKNDFFEDVIFKDKLMEKELKQSILNWVILLQYNDIILKKFKDLFKIADKIVFPIQIDRVDTFRYSGWFQIEFTDQQGEKYNMSKMKKTDQKTLEIYSIGKEDSTENYRIYRENSYKLLKSNEIVVVETEIFRSYDDEDDVNVCHAHFYYDCGNKTEVYMQLLENNPTLVMRYPKNSETDKKVEEFLMTADENKWYYYDLSSVLRFIVGQRVNDKFSFSILSQREGEIYSRIDVVEGTVQRYTTTEIISEEKMIITTQITVEKLEDFLKKPI